MASSTDVRARYKSVNSIVITVTVLISSLRRRSVRSITRSSMASKDSVNNAKIKGAAVWQTVAKVYNEFSAHSTIHGIKYTTQAKTPFGRLIWLFIVILSIIASCQLAYKFYERHESANMRTLVISNQYPSWKLALPAITICHSNVASLDRLQPYLDKKKLLVMPLGVTLKSFKDALKYLAVVLYPNNRYEQQLLLLDRVLKANRMSVFDLFELTTPKCDDFVVMCQFEGKVKDCHKIISTSLTSHGLCCSYNYGYAMNERSNRWNTSSSAYSVNFGARFILSFLIKSHGPEDRVSSRMYGDGVKVLIHERYTYPGPMTLEFVAATGQETVARLYGRYLTASPEVLAMKPEERDCKKSISRTDRYRADNCYMKCRDNNFLRSCGCLPFFSLAMEEGKTVCNVSHITCLSRIYREASAVSLRDAQCNCLPDCESTIFSLVTTTLPFNAPQFNPSEFYKKARTLTNATAIHITYSEQSSMLQRRELVLSWINLVSSLGGVFSLFLGSSFISIIEIFYFFCVYLVWKLRRRLLSARTTFRTT